MAYKSMAPQLKMSCYNCQHFVVSSDMMNGQCFHNSSSNGKSAIGIGTCDSFNMKDTSKDYSPWSGLLRKQPVPLEV